MAVRLLSLFCLGRYWMLITHLSVGGLVNIAWIGAIALCSWKDRSVWRLDEPAYGRASRRLRRG
jgi:predicted metal-binding membrane protein